MLPLVAEILIKIIRGRKSPNQSWICTRILRFCLQNSQAFMICRYAMHKEHRCFSTLALHNAGYRAYIHIIK
ncbi:MAG TPA: hypothetical protein DDW73_23095 [Rhizobium sp.]|nr:hypothetical protein [Rhizobium sp.]